MKEFYNKHRVIATLTDLWNEATVQQELNFPTYPFSSERAADGHTRKAIENWIAEVGNRKYASDLELSYWKAI